MPLSDAQKTAMGYLGMVQAAIDKVDPIMKNTVVDFWGFGSSDVENLRSNVANFDNGGTPFGFLVNIFQMLGSYDKMIEWLTNFLVKSLPALEITIKGVILSNLRNMMTCNIDPRIPEIYRKDGLVMNPQTTFGNGIYVNIDSIDYGHILDYSPLTEEGCVYYFGTYTESEPRPVKKDWKNYTIKEKMKFIKSRGKETPDTMMMVKKKTFVNAYRLARAYDFNAFLWFVIHKGRLPLPIVANVNVDNGSNDTTSSALRRALINDQDNDGYVVKKFSYDAPEEQKNLEFFGSAISLTTDKPLLKGTTVSLNYVANNSSKVASSNIIQMATAVDSVDVNGAFTSTATFAPVSDDCYSANWYADPSNYYAYNLSLPKSKRPKHDYNKSKPICNIRYVNQGKSANLANNHKLLVSIPPKPFVTYSYNVDQISDLFAFPFVNKILFDEDGKPSKKGHFSLRNYDNQGRPYVRPERDSLPSTVCNIWLNKYLQTVTEDGTKDSELITVLSSTTASSSYDFYNSIANHAKSALGSYVSKIRSMTSVKDFKKKFNVPESGTTEEFSIGDYFIQAKSDMLEANGVAEKYSEICLMSKYTKEDLSKFEEKIIKLYEKFINLLQTAARTRSSETGEPDYMEFDRFYVGYTDDCMLYVNRFTGEYALGSSNIEPGGKLVMKESYKAHLQECYAGLTVYEFNYDLIMGMKLFDARVLATSLVSALYNLSLGVGVSVRMPSMWGNEEASMVRTIITEILNSSDDTEITDCFFTFTNEKYEDLLNKAEKKYLDTGTLNVGSGLENVKINTKPLMDILEEYDENGTIEEQTDVISRFFKQATVSYTEEEGDMTDTDKNYVQAKFATNLIGALASVLIEAILTPKVLLAYQVNREMVGGSIADSQNFKEFLTGIKMLIVAMVKEIRDIILKELMDIAMSLINQLISKFGIAVLKEQLQVYKDLFDKLMRDCAPNIAMLISMFKRAPRTLVDTTLPVVEYADIMSNTSDALITTEGTEPIIDNC